MKILVVDDEEKLIEILQNNFQKWNWSSVGVNSVPEALNTLDDTFDVILTDVRLPRLSGLDLLRNVKELYSDLEVVLMTSYKDIKNSIKAVNLGANSFLLKPLDMYKLKDALEKASSIKIAKQQARNYKKNLQNMIEERTKELQNSEERYRKVVQLAPACIWTVDRTGKFLSIESDMLEKMLDYPVDQMIKYSFNNNPWETEKSKKIHTLVLNEVLKGKFVRGIETPLLKKNGEIIYVAHNLAPHLDEKGNIKGCIGVTTDITDRIEAEEHLKMLAQTIRSVNYSICITNMDNNIIFVNKAFTNTYGYIEEEIIGQDINILWSNSSDTISEEMSIETYKHGWEGEIQNIRKDGSKFPVYVSTSVIKDDTGKPVAFVSMSHDITEMKRLQNEIIHSEKLISAGKVASGIAHELRNQLSAISTSTQFCLDSLSPSQKIEEHLKRIEQNLNFAGRVLNELLSFARPTTKNFIRININTVLDKVISIIEGKLNVKNIRMITEFSKDLPETVINEPRIRELIMNLMINAIEASENGSDIKLISKYDFKNTAIIINIIDKGTGISEDQITQVFDPFFTNKEFGTGLGLSICQQIVNEHNGKISVINNPEKGCTFEIIIPVQQFEKQPERKSINEMNISENPNE